jgi:hypothetical protein
LALMRTTAREDETSFFCFHLFFLPLCSNTKLQRWLETYYRPGIMHEWGTFMAEGNYPARVYLKVISS